MLVQYNPQLQFVPDFARSWTESSGGKVWTFHTQPGAKWSDGKPLTAADAAWTYSTILKYQDGPTANSAGYVAHMKSATAPNATTLVLTYKRPVANVLSQVQQAPILPEHVWAKYATGNGKALTRFQNNAPIVSGGPFILTKYTPKQIVLFKRNPTFYGTKPHIDGLGLQFFQTTDAMITALKSNQLDGVETVTPTSVATLKAAHFVVPSSPGVVFDDFIINANPQQEASHRELMNPLVRQAFDAAIDRQAIVHTSLLGHGKPGSSIIPPATGHWNDPAIKPDRVQPGQGQPAAGPGRVQDGAGRGADGQRPPDVVSGDHADRHPEPLRPAVVPDHPGRLQEDRRPAEPQGAGRLGRVQRDHGQQLQELRDLDVGLVPAHRPGLHAVRADLRVAGTRGTTPGSAARPTTACTRRRARRPARRNGSRSSTRCSR